MTNNLDDVLFAKACNVLVELLCHPYEVRRNILWNALKAVDASAEQRGRESAAAIREENTHLQHIIDDELQPDLEAAQARIAELEAALRKIAKHRLYMTLSESSDEYERIARACGRDEGKAMMAEIADAALSASEVKP